MPDTPETDLTLSFAPTLRPARGGAEEPSPLEAGKVFGFHRLLRKLGEGGFAEVWEAEELESGRRLALKVLTRVRVASPESLERFQREGRLAASLNHPRCVYVFGAGEIAGYPAILMELVPGGTLQDRLDREGPVEPRRAVDLILDLLDGLEAAHRAGILHRDVKPSNCFVDEDGRAKIGDFGLSRALETDVSLTQTGAFLGTPVYASPEQVRGRDVDLRSDLYSVGATLYALLAGKPPFTATGAGEVLARILSEAPLPLREKEAKLSRGLERVVLRLLSKDPQKRFPDYASLRAALLPFSSAGMTAAGLARRLVAHLLDQVIRLPVDFAVTFPLWMRGLGSPAAVRYLLFSVAFDFLYFTVTEKVWGRSLGKALCGLYVTNRAGERMTWGQAAARTLVYLIPCGSFPFLALALVLGERLHSPPFPIIIPYIPWLGMLVIVSTMRLRNGFAGPHELATGTRVRVARRKERPAAPLGLEVSSLPFTLPPPDFGPFRPSEIVWEEIHEALLIARDTLLGRPVWIHRFQDAARGRPIQELARSRPARLRWLQGRRAEGMSWDAYEAPTGGTLEDWVRARGQLSWGEVRGVLLGLARALEDGLREGLPEQLPPSHVWVDGLGQVRILDFPVRSREGVPPPAGWHPADWRRYLAGVALFCLEGPAAAPGEEGAVEMPRAALPEHARVLLERLASAGSDPAGLLRFREGLQESSERPAALTRPRRAATLILATLPASISVLMLVLVFPILFWAAPEVVHLGSVSQYLERREALKASAGSSEARRMQEAIDIVLAASYQRYRDTPFGQQILAQKSETTRTELERLLNERPSTSKEEFDRARALVESSFLRRIVRADSLAATFLVLALLVGLVAVPMSFILRGGVLFRLLGVTVQRADGRPVSRLRCLARGLAVWSPAFAGMLVIRLLPRIPAARAGVLFFFLALFLAAAAYALARPTRGVQDILTGTRLVPR